VKNDSVAFSKWKEIKHVYKDVDFVSSGDTGLLARYCMTFSEYRNLVEHRQRIDNIDFNPEEIEEASEEFQERLGSKKAANDLFRKIDYIISIGGVLQIESAINKKMDLLIKMEDRLFLNPLAKIKNVPKEKKEEEIDPHAKMFGD
jgi:phage terminase small subunit